MILGPRESLLLAHLADTQLTVIFYLNIFSYLPLNSHYLTIPFSYKMSFPRRNSETGLHTAPLLQQAGNKR